MICISVTPTSRKLAKVDLLNAAGQCDLIELCLDRLIKPPDMKDLLDGVKKPVLVSCRLKEDGGNWAGTDEERLTLLREAIVAGPAYVELDMDTAKRVPRFGDTKRVVSYTRLDKPLGSIDTIFDRAAQANADVVKVTWPTPTLETAWPLLLAVSKKRELPVVGLGLGRAGLTFSLLGRKYGSPWIYAALEKGMEAFKGQQTVGELDEIYGWREITSQTRFLGIVGFGESETTTIRLFNKTCQDQGINARCLPLASRKVDQLKKMLDVLKINAILIHRDFGEQILPVADKREEAARTAMFADLLLKQPDGWNAYNNVWRSAIKSLEDSLGKSAANDRPLDRRNVVVIGCGGLARSMIFGVGRRKGMVSVSGPVDKDAQQTGQMFNARYVPFHSLYDTLADVVVLAEPDLQIGTKKGDFNPSYLRPPMTVIDVTQMPTDSPLIQEARQRGCKVVEPVEIYVDHIASQFKSVTGKEVDPQSLRDQLSNDQDDV